MHPSKRKAMIASFLAKREYFHGRPMVPLVNRVTVLGRWNVAPMAPLVCARCPLPAPSAINCRARFANTLSRSAPYTDSLRSYRNMDDYQHEFIDHAEEYVRGNVHTNGMESYWSLLKRALHGTYISVEPFHLFRYLDEQAFRFNNRMLKDGQRFVLAMAGIVGKRITYKELIAADAGQA